MFFGVCARSMVLTYKYSTPVCGSGSVSALVSVLVHAPSCSRTVAYLEFASGQLCRVQKPVTLYSFLQKFWVVVLWEAFSDGLGVVGKGNVLDFVGTELCVDHRPYNVVALHGAAGVKGARKSK